jgi:hypothetical protein
MRVDDVLPTRGMGRPSACSPNLRAGRCRDGEIGRIPVEQQDHSCGHLQVALCRIGRFRNDRHAAMPYDASFFRRCRETLRRATRRRYYETRYYGTMSSSLGNHGGKSLCSMLNASSPNASTP